MSHEVHALARKRNERLALQYENSFGHVTVPSWSVMFDSNKDEITDHGFHTARVMY